MQYRPKSTYIDETHIDLTSRPSHSSIGHKEINIPTKHQTPLLQKDPYNLQVTVRSTHTNNNNKEISDWGIPTLYSKLQQ